MPLAADDVASSAGSASESEESASERAGEGERRL
jgi:hypothetical protein